MTTSILESLNSSTVPGSLPTLLLADVWESENSGRLKNGTSRGNRLRPQYPEIFRYLELVLNEFIVQDASLPQHTVILTGMGVSPFFIWRDLMSYTKYEPILYDCGIKTFQANEPVSMLNEYHTLHYDYLNNAETQNQNLKSFLSGPGGLLVTHNVLFSGMEAPTVIYITKDITSDTYVRSALLRAVGKLIVITNNDSMYRMEELKNKFIVKQMEHTPILSKQQKGKLERYAKKPRNLSKSQTNI